MNYLGALDSGRSLLGLARQKPTNTTEESKNRRRLFFRASLGCQWRKFEASDMNGQQVAQFYYLSCCVERAGERRSHCRPQTVCLSTFTVVLAPRLGALRPERVSRFSRGNETASRC